MICHCSRHEFRFFGTAEIYLHFFSSFFSLFSSFLRLRWRQQKFTTTRTMRKMLSSSLVWVNVTFNRLFTAVTMNGWVLLKAFFISFFLRLLNLRMMEEIHLDLKQSSCKSLCRKNCCWWIKKKNLFMGVVIDLCQEIIHWTSFKEKWFNFNYFSSFTGVFLICWVPFFTCNIMDAMCTKLNYDCQPGVTAFILTTWLG